MNLPKITKDNECLYLTQDISGMGLYEQSKAIVNFCDKETKLFEKEIDRAILDIFEKNGINIPNTQKSVLKLAFDLLKAKGKDIEVKDSYREQVDLYNSKLIRETKLFTIWLEDDTYLQCGIRIREISV
jgi:hypothetical protein